MSDLKIPENWKWVKMKNVSKLIRGVNYKKNEASRINEKGKKFIIRGNNIQNGKLEFDNLVYVLKDNINEDQFIRKNDIIITMSSGSKRLVGKAARVKKDMDGGFGAFCGLIRPMEVINGIYLGYFFQSNLYRYQISKLSKGVNINNLRRSYIEDLDFPLAPLEHQNQIVEKIEELFSKLDAGIEALQKNKILLEKYRQSVLNAAMKGELTREWREQQKEEGEKVEEASVILNEIANEQQQKWEMEYLEKLALRGKIPKNDKWKLRYKKEDSVVEEEMSGLPLGWRWAYLNNIVEKPKDDIVDGPFGSNLKASEYIEEGVPVLRIQNIKRNKFINKNIRFVTAIKARELKRHSYNSGEIIITKLGDPLGQACIVPNYIDDGIFVADLVRVRLKNSNIDKQFLVHAINSNVVVKQFIPKIKGTTRPRVNLTFIRNLKIPIPPYKEQLEIKNRVDTIESNINYIKNEIKEGLSNARKLRQSILKNAFEGKLLKNINGCQKENQKIEEEINITELGEDYYE